MAETPLTVTETDVKDSNLLLRYLRKSSARILDLGSRLSNVERTPNPPSFQQIRDQLQATGVAPLNLTALPGVAAQPQLAGAPRLSTAPSGLVLQQYRDTQLLLVGTTSTGYALNAVLGGNPTTLYQLVGNLTTGTVISTSTDLMTLDTVQTSTGAKTLQGLWTHQANIIITTTNRLGVGTTTPGTGGDVGPVVHINATSSSSPSTWAGRLIAQGPASAFVAGELNTVPTIGGHSAALNAWTDLMINPGGGKLGIGLGTSTAPSYLIHAQNGGTSLMKIGDGTNPSIGGAYGLFSASTGNAGFTINRDSTSAYASIDIISTGSVNSGWSIQMQPSTGGLHFVNRSPNTDVFFVSTGGNVGVGTAIPEVIGSTTGLSGLFLNQTSTIATARLSVQGTTAANLHLVASANSANKKHFQLQNSGDQLTVYLNDDATPLPGATGLLVITSSGSQQITGKVTSYNGIVTAGQGLSVIVAVVDLTDQTATIGATNLLASATNGVYRASLYIDTSSAGAAGTVTATIGWNDGDSAESITTGSVSLTALAGDFATLNQVLRSGGGSNITYSTTVVGAVGSPKYHLAIVLERLA